MMNNQTTSTTSSPATSRYTADAIVYFFADLNLPVTDDLTLINKKVHEAQPRYVRMKAQSTSPKDWDLADKWFTFKATLETRLASLLDVMYSKFAVYADTSLKAALHSGTTTLTQDLVGELESWACDDKIGCRAEQQLAKKWRKRYMEERGLKLDDPLVKPELVENFTATGGADGITLGWSWPGRDCDALEIVREAPGAARKGDGERFSVRCDKPDLTFDDKGAAPGVWHTYHAYSLCRGVRSTGCRSARAVRVAEVGQPTATWKDQSVFLSWTLPSPDVSVRVFRRTGGDPSTRSGPQGVEPADASTAEVHRGGGSSWPDRSVVEGASYRYLIVAEFGHGQFSRGVLLRVRVPKPPPPVAALTAAYKRNAGKDEVDLEWRPVETQEPVEYVAVRRDGSKAPTRIEEGTVVIRTTSTKCVDAGVVPGRRYCYAVFVNSGGLVSRTGTAAPAVDILAEVSGLTVTTGDKVAQLEWETPANARVVVKRDIRPPGDHHGGHNVPLIGAGRARDSGLENGRTYYYLVSCAYRPNGTDEVFSKGVPEQATPQPLPDVVKSFSAKAQGNEIHCSWTAPAVGQVVVVRSAKSPSLTVGERLATGRVSRMGQAISTRGSDTAFDPQPDVAQPYYSVFSIAGSHALYGGTCDCVVCPDVSDLRATGTRNGVTLQWKWPAGCTAVRVVRRVGAWPEGPNDPKAVSIACMRTDYTAAGEKFVDVIREGGGRIHYVVHAQAAGAPGLFFAPGNGPGCRKHVHWSSWMSIRYRLEAPRKGPHRKKSLRLSWNAENPPPDFAGLVLVASDSGVPATPDEGIELFRWTPGPGEAEGSHEAWVSLAPVQRRSWPHFYCKAMVLDPAQRDSVLIVHPDTCLPFARSGESPHAKASQATERYRRVVPRRIICPTCFEEFGIEEMLFGNYPSPGQPPTEPVRGRHTWFDRLLGRPPRPPVDEHGHRLTRRLCPPRRDDLPFSAGTQKSVVIGLVGATASGKSHFIASLVHRLEGQVGQDLHSALMPMTDETSARYRREFYNPLFRNHSPLQATAGVPPPLIYDLTWDGKLWGQKDPRAVTLSLYDTAGENLKNPEVFRQFVKYVGIASGLLLLVDPLQLKQVQEALPAGLRPDPLPPSQGTTAPQETPPHTILELIYNNLGSSASTPPLAVVLTKCDVLRDAGLIPENRLWSTDTRHVGVFNREAHADMTGLFGEFMRLWYPEVYNKASQHFPRHAFFGVSATGCAPDRGTGTYKYVAPWRVEDPLLWVLHELGILPGSQ